MTETAMGNHDPIDPRNEARGNICADNSADSPTDARKREILRKIGNFLLKYMPQPGIFNTKIHGLQLVRRDIAENSRNCLEKPFASLIVQGEKHIVIGAREHLILPGDCLLVAVDMPASSMVKNISPACPFLSLLFDLDRKIFSDLLMQMPHVESDSFAEIQGVSVREAEYQFMDAILRLLELLDKPEQIPIMGDLVLRELHYYLLIGPQGEFLRTFYMLGAKNHQIMEIITWLKSNLTQPARIEDLARQAHMSVSSLHRHFKRLTGLSPLQYHKQLRLYEAQRLMLAENERAATAALSVGYESVTQFNREYKRLFGQPPHRDINRRRGGSQF